MLPYRPSKEGLPIAPTPTRARTTTTAVAARDAGYGYIYLYTMVAGRSGRSHTLPVLLAWVQRGTHTLHVVLVYVPYNLNAFVWTRGALKQMPLLSM